MKKKSNYILSQEYFPNFVHLATSATSKREKFTLFAHCYMLLHVIIWDSFLQAYYIFLKH